MDYQFRIPAVPEYVVAIGRAFYNFTYLEAVVISIIARLSRDGYDGVPRGEGATASKIARALHVALEGTPLPLPGPLRSRVANFHQDFHKAIKDRNKLLHARPYTSQAGLQQLGYYDPGQGHLEWSIEKVYTVARSFEELAVEGGDIFHQQLGSLAP